MTMRFGEGCAIERGAGQLSGRASPWPGWVRRGTRLAPALNQIVTAPNAMRQTMPQPPPARAGSFRDPSQTFATELPASAFSPLRTSTGAVGLAELFEKLSAG